MVQLIVQGFWFGLLLDLTVQRLELFYCIFTSSKKGVLFSRSGRLRIIDKEFVSID